jgi:hypothetical protein
MSWFRAFVPSRFRDSCFNRLAIRPWTDLASHCEFARASLAIVGNAGYLSEIDQGDYLDSHDLVLRMNNFRTAGYERQVGQKLDVFISTFHSDVDLTNPALNEARFIVASVPNNGSKPRNSSLNYRHARFIARGLRTLGRDTAYVPEEAYFLSLRKTLGSYPTTGAMALLLAIDFLLPVCSRIYVTGFSFFTGRTHYFSGQHITPTNHNPSRERDLLSRRVAPHLLTGRIHLDDHMQSRLLRRAA